MSVRIYARKYYVFLPDYVRWSLTPAAAVRDGSPTHVFFLFTDHFEPDYDLQRTITWGTRYAELAKRHRDSTGRPPQHSWFYPGEQLDDNILTELRRWSLAGLGEVELHHHHDYDTEETLGRSLRESIATFQKFGFLRTIRGDTQFAFVHGNAGLDNSGGPQMCGVNTEIRLLRSLGCFADFTFPSIYEDAQPGFVNSIYAVKDDERPKSYGKVRLPVSDVGAGRADLVIFEGPLVFGFSKNPRHLGVQLDDGDIHAAVPASPARADRWVRANVHVPQRPDWVFVKLFGHTASNDDEVEAGVGDAFDRTLTYLESKYNDGHRYVLHYVTAREAYNLVRAAADGASGDPQQYYDYIVPPYVASASRR